MELQVTNIQSLNNGGIHPRQSWQECDLVDIAKAGDEKKSNQDSETTVKMCE